MEAKALRELRAAMASGQFAPAYYIHGDDLKLMVDYIHTWSDFREANPEFGQDDFDEVIGRVQVMF